MSLSNTSRSYGGVTKAFHWLTALLIFTVIPLGWIATDLAEQIRRPEIAPSDADVARAALLFSVHKTLGVAIFAVALARIAWALSQTRPGLLNGDRRIEATAAELAHWLLYGSLLLVPLTGWIHHAATTGFAPILWPFGQSLPFVPKSQSVAGLFGGAHQVLVMVLIGALLAHVGGALKHLLIDRDYTLQRMLPGFGPGPRPPAMAHRLAPVLLAVVVWAGALAAGAVTGTLTGHAPGPIRAAALERVQSDWIVQDGTLAIDIRQMGNTVSGRFADWTAAIDFAERDDPGIAGRVMVTVAIGSLTLGSVTGQAMGPDFFDAETFPTAEFRADIVRTADGYAATGPLTIKGTTVPITLPFALQLDGDTARMQGSLTLDRTAFGIGDSMTDEGSLGFAVEVRVDLTATRPEAQPSS